MSTPRLVREPSPSTSTSIFRREKLKSAEPARRFPSEKLNWPETVISEDGYVNCTGVVPPVEIVRLPSAPSPSRSRLGKSTDVPSDAVELKSTDTALPAASTSNPLAVSKAENVTVPIPLRALQLLVSETSNGDRRASPNRVISMEKPSPPGWPTNAVRSSPPTVSSETLLIVSPESNSIVATSRRVKSRGPASEMKSPRTIEESPPRSSISPVRPPSSRIVNTSWDSAPSTVSICEKAISRPKVVNVPAFVSEMVHTLDVSGPVSWSFPSPPFMARVPTNVGSKLSMMMVSSPLPALIVNEPAGLGKVMLSKPLVPLLSIVRKPSVGSVSITRICCPVPVVSSKMRSTITELSVIGSRPV